MLLALSASVIVVLVLLWEVAWPVASERIERWRAQHEALVREADALAHASQLTQPNP